MTIKNEYPAYVVSKEEVKGITREYEIYPTGEEGVYKIERFETHGIIGHITRLEKGYLVETFNGNGGTLKSTNVNNALALAKRFHENGAETRLIANRIGTGKYTIIERSEYAFAKLVGEATKIDNLEWRLNMYDGERHFVRAALIGEVLEVADRYFYEQ